MSRALKLVIEMDDKGNVQLLGPIDNRLECYGLLGIAHDLIKDYHDQKNSPEQPAIVRPSQADVLSIGRKPGHKS